MPIEDQYIKEALDHAIAQTFMVAVDWAKVIDHLREKYPHMDTEYLFMIANRARFQYDKIS